MNKTVELIAGVATAIVGVAIVAVLVSKKSNTSEVIASLGTAYASALREAVSPITA